MEERFWPCVCAPVRAFPGTWLNTNMQSHEAMDHQKAFDIIEVTSAGAEYGAAEHMHRQTPPQQAAFAGASGRSFRVSPSSVRLVLPQQTRWAPNVASPAEEAPAAAVARADDAV